MSCSAQPEHSHPCTLGFFLAKVPSRIFHLELRMEAQEEEQREQESVKLLTAPEKV